MGVSLKTFIAGKVLERSKHELLYSDKIIKEIAGALGFYDEFHFSKFFKKHTHVSPAEYRKQSFVRRINQI